MKISVIIPMHNESNIIEKNAVILSQYLESHFDSYQLIFSDDGSNDGCGELIKNLCLPHTEIIRSDENKGKGFAIRQGVAVADGDVVIFTDADLAYGTDVLAEAVKVLGESDCDILIGSRNTGRGGYGNYPKLRTLASKVYIWTLGKLFSLKYSDFQCGFKAFDGNCAKKIFSLGEINGFAFDLECLLLAQKLGYKITEIPVKITTHKSSNVSVFKDSVGMLFDVIKIKRKIRKTLK